MPSVPHNSLAALAEPNIRSLADPQASCGRAGEDGREPRRPDPARAGKSVEQLVSGSERLRSLRDEVVTPFAEFAGQACESAMFGVEGTQR